jgi:hypothetical protein
MGGGVRGAFAALVCVACGTASAYTTTESEPETPPPSTSSAVPTTASRPDDPATCVDSSSAAWRALADCTLTKCIRVVFKTMTFPPPQGGFVTVVYPLALEVD